MRGVARSMFRGCRVPACLPWPFAVPVAMAVVSSAVPAIPRSAPSSAKVPFASPEMGLWADDIG